MRSLITTKKQISIMKNKTFPNTNVVQKEPFKIEATVSGGTNISELGLKHGLEGKEAQLPEFLMYYTAWAFGHREYLLNQSSPVAQ